MGSEMGMAHLTSLDFGLLRLIAFGCGDDLPAFLAACLRNRSLYELLRPFYMLKRQTGLSLRRHLVLTGDQGQCWSVFRNALTQPDEHGNNWDATDMWGMINMDRGTLAARLASWAVVWSEGPDLAIMLLRLHQMSGEVVGGPFWEVRRLTRMLEYVKFPPSGYHAWEDPTAGTSELSTVYSSNFRSITVSYSVGCPDSNLFVCDDSVVVQVNPLSRDACIEIHKQMHPEAHLWLSMCYRCTRKWLVCCLFLRGDCFELMGQPNFIDPDYVP